ncbi:SGNH/GDSL hydrolase family protein [bacterium]|nr:SGNH/GDSL hydrolase family protein [bacterium]
MKFAITSGQKILFMGDSITDCSRRTEPSGLGNGYVKTFKDMVIANMPELKIDIINKGIGGNTLLDLENRWSDDILYFKPDWLSILVGINDVHRVLRKTEFWEELVPEKYELRYSKLIDSTIKQIGCNIILIEPFYMSTDKTDSHRGVVLKRLEPYREIVAKLSKQYNTRIIKIHDIFQEHLKYREAGAFGAEPVHPNDTGHLIIAQTLFDLLKQ